MKKSKKLIIKFIEIVIEYIFTKKIYSYFLFLRFYNKFKRSINRKKQKKKFSENLDQINNFEYKITSQNNEDGIIEYIFSKIPNNKKFVEIGFEFSEFNSLNLIKKNWSGLLIDRDEYQAYLTSNLIKFFFPRSKVIIKSLNINRNNINHTIKQNIFFNQIDFFSLDIDGNDYWVLKNMILDNIKCICIEYNHWLGAKTKKSIPYDPNFRFINNGFFGASLLAFNSLLKKRNFYLVAVDSSGTNAFFVNNLYKGVFEELDPIKSFKSAPYLYSKVDKERIFKNIKNFNFQNV